MSKEKGRPWYRRLKYLIPIIAVILGAILAPIMRNLLAPPPPADFSISVDPMKGEVQQGRPIQAMITIEDVHGYKYQVTLGASEQPSGVVVTFIPIGGPTPPYNSTVTINVDPNVPVGDYTIMIKGTGADGKEHTCTYFLTVIPGIPPEPCTGRSPGISESFSVYPNYDPSGYMGDTGDIRDPARGSEGVCFTYEVGGRGPREWEWKYVDCELNPNPARFVGVMYLCCGWGQQPGFDLRAFRRAVAWEARSLSDEVNVEFVIGGINWVWDEQEKIKVKPPCPDSLWRKSLGTYTLTEEWQSFQVDLSNMPEEEFVNVIGGFSWIITWGSNEIQPNEGGTGPQEPKTFEIEIRNIRYER